MDLTQISAMTVAAVGPALPYLLRASEEVAEEATRALGKAAWDGAKAIWDRLRPKLDSHAHKVAERLIASPQDDDALAALRMEVKEILTADQKLTEDLTKLLKAAGQTHVSVIASGTGAVAIGRDACGTTIVTGSHGSVGGKQPR